MTAAVISFRQVVATGFFARTLLSDQPVFEPLRLIQAARPVTGLRVIEDVSTALRHNREEEIALPKLKEELAIHPGIGVHQLDRVTELFVAFPHTLDLDDPYVLLCLHDLPRKDVLGMVETCFGRNGSA